jgi:lipopolysaccharide export system permease protein
MAIGGYALAISVLLTLFGFIVFLEQLEDVGDGSYDTLDAALYVLLTLPALLMRLAPVGALLGGLLAAASLARNSELIAIRSAGVSSLRLSWSFLRPALAFVILLVVVGEYIAPPLQQAAERGRSIQVTDVNDVLRGKGLWSRDGLRFLYVRALRHGQIPAGIDLYEFDPSGQLRRYLHAEQADVLADGAWRLRNVRQKRTVDGTPSNQWLAELHWQPFWSSDQMKVLQLPADSLSYTKLLDYRAYLHSTGQTTERADLLF